MTATDHSEKMSLNWNGICNIGIKYNLSGILPGSLGNNAMKGLYHLIDHSEVCLPFSRLLLSIWSIWDVVFHENYSKLYIEEVNFELLRLLQSNVSK